MIEQENPKHKVKISKKDMQKLRKIGNILNITESEVVEQVVESLYKSATS